MPRYSIIIPIYNRPDECAELLESLCQQEERDFEVIVVEDGSTLTSKTVCQAYTSRLDLHYFEKPNSGPAQSRNYGAAHATGDYLLILDSDVVLPTGYISAISAALRVQDLDAFGGPDRAHHSFTPMQKAINYSMTSFFTTGGIRGGKKQLDKFYPRSFNMGVRRELYALLGGFSDMRFGEDIDFSTRIFAAGRRCQLLPEAWVWHKRRTDLRKFFKQVFNSGIARIHLSQRHPGTLKLVHLLPAVFTLGVVFLLTAYLIALILIVATGSSTSLWSAQLWLLPLAAYAALVALHASIVEGSLAVGLRAVAAAFVQLGGYGTGFLSAWWQCKVRGRGEYAAFEKNFYQ